MEEKQMTAFPETGAGLASTLAEAALDHAAFEMPLPVCVLSTCRATCCHDGVILSDEEAEVLGAEGPGIVALPDGSFKTETIAASPHQLAERFPKHFPTTRCVFLDDQHRCQWQLRAVAEGKQPWFYKPSSCWMHPVLLTRREGRPLLTLVSREQDQARFASDTPCGAATEGAPPARESLKMELEMLGALAGRDLYGELNAPPGFSC